MVQQTNKQTIAVLIPCYNESKTIEKVVKDFAKALPSANIYVFDNNSTDGTDTIAQNAGAIVKYEYRQGKGKRTAVLGSRRPWNRVPYQRQARHIPRSFRQVLFRLQAA